MINPFAGKKNLLEPQAELELSNFTEADVAEIIETPEEKPKAWQTLLGIVFGNGVAHLPVPTIHDKPMTKRRFRRLRGKVKASRVTVQYQ